MIGVISFRRLRRYTINSMKSTKETIIFYHLPKTAGTTLNNVIHQNYSDEEIVSPGIDTHKFVADFKTWPNDKKASIRLLQGHLPFGFDQYLPKPSRCFTILRHPIARTISYYYHAKRDKSHYLHDLIVHEKMPLKELIESGEALMMNDGQTRLLSSVWGDAPVLGVTEEIVETAVFNLRKMAVVGLTEQFDATLLLLKHTFAWENIYYRRANVGSNRRDPKEFDNDTIKTIVDHNRKDLYLYQVAKKIFTQQVKAYTTVMPIRVPYFRMKQKAHHFSFAYYLQRLSRG